jgi:hypothetical protein
LERYERRVRINGPRPSFSEVAEDLWGGGVEFDSDGNSTAPDDAHWTELIIQRRQPPLERVDIDPVSDSPLVLRIVASSDLLAQRAAEFLKHRTDAC